MAFDVSPIPEDFHTITPHLVVKGTREAIEFYQDAFGAEELYRNIAPDGESIIHSELLLGDSRFFVNEEFASWGVFSPLTHGGTAVTLHIYVEDVDAAYKQAREAGCKVLFELQDTFWGDRYCKLEDPFGHQWSIASRVEDLSPQEVNARAKKFFGDTKE